jgi:pimeloyl-ACP methyl ester carboxylesterase
VRRGFKILLGIVALLAVMLAVNTIATDSETKPAKADGGRIVDLPGGDLQVREDGRVGGPPVVLIHGWIASIHWWGRITPLLARRDRVIRVDLLGHGGSEKPRNGYSMEEQADRVALVLARLRVRRALVVGHSTGSEVAVALAARHPELARRLVVIDSEPDERFVSPDFLAKLSVTGVIGEALKRPATDGTIRDGLEQGFAKGFPVPDRFVRDFNKLTYGAYEKTYDKSGDYGD